MKKYAGLTAIVAAAVLIGLSGSGFAAEQAKAKVTEIGQWEYFEAIETGNLPPELKGGQEGAVSMEKVPTVEIGGVTYRIGIDTN